MGGRKALRCSYSTFLLLLLLLLPPPTLTPLLLLDVYFLSCTFFTLYLCYCLYVCVRQFTRRRMYGCGACMPVWVVCLWCPPCLCRYAHPHESKCACVGVCLYVNVCMLHVFLYVCMFLDDSIKKLLWCAL